MLGLGGPDFLMPKNRPSKNSVQYYNVCIFFVTPADIPGMILRLPLGPLSVFKGPASKGRGAQGGKEKGRGRKSKGEKRRGNGP